MAPSQFAGLTMPVFTAFGWAGQEAAMKYALEQLEAFIKVLHGNLPRQVQHNFPFAGISRANQTIYLAAAEDVESDIHIIFIARPMSLELQLVLTEKKTIARALQLSERQPIMAHRLITELGGDWSLRVQQMQVDEDSGEAAHYQDLFKDNVVALDEDTARDLINKAVYLNGEDRWVTPLYLSRRFPSEQVAAMGPAVLNVMTTTVEKLMPTVSFWGGQKVAKGGKTTAKSRTTRTRKTAEVDVEPITAVAPEEGFEFVTDLKPLHLRKGFINLTEQHWAFFALNSRTETRPVTVYYDGIYDKDSAVWRLVPSDKARLVLSSHVQSWLEDNFTSDDRIQLVVRRLAAEEIQISLKHVA